MLSGFLARRIHTTFPPFPSLRFPRYSGALASARGILPCKMRRTNLCGNGLGGLLTDAEAKLTDEESFAKLVAPHEGLRRTESAKEVEDFAILECMIVRGHRPDRNGFDRLIIHDAVTV